MFIFRLTNAKWYRPAEIKISLRHAAVHIIYANTQCRVPLSWSVLWLVSVCTSSLQVATNPFYEEEDPYSFERQPRSPARARSPARPASPAPRARSPPPIRDMSPDPRSAAFNRGYASRLSFLCKRYLLDSCGRK